MKIKKLTAYIDNEQFELVRLIAYKYIVSLSTVVRWCIDDYCKKHNYSIKRLSDPLYDYEYEEFIINQEKEKKIWKHYQKRKKIDI